jgi:hypothetical protein
MSRVNVGTVATLPAVNATSGLIVMRKMLASLVSIFLKIKPPISGNLWRKNE